MPNYRQAGADAFASASDLFGKILYQKFASQDQWERQRAIQAGQFGNQLMEKLLSDPALARRFKSGGVSDVGGIPIGLLAPSDQEVLSPELARLGGVTNLDALPDDATESAWAASQGLTDPKQLLATLAAKRGALQTAERSKGSWRSQTAPDGSTSDVFIPNTEAAGHAPLKTGLTAQEQGAYDATKFLTGEGSPVVSAQKVANAQDMERGLGPLKARTAGMTAGAEANARLGVEGSPAALDLFKRHAEITASTRPATDTELLNAASFPQILTSNATAKSLEAKGASVSPFSLQMFVSPGLQAAGSIASHIPGLGGLGMNPQQQAYMQSVYNWTNQVTFALSGKQTRAEEFPRFALTYFPTDTEAKNPALIAQKQRQREVLQMAAQIALGNRGGKREAGRAIGRALQAGIVSRDAVGQLDPEVAQGVMESYGGQP